MGQYDYITLASSKIEGIQFDVVLKTDNTEKLIHGLESAYFRGLKKIGMKAESYAKRKCPWKTGRLRNSITHKVSGHDVYIGSPVEYAKYVECGTGRNSTVGGNPLFEGMVARPYLKPAATEHSKEYGDALKEEVAKIK